MKISKTAKALIIITLIITVAVVAVKNMKVPEVSIADIDFASLQDGKYPGTYVLGPVKASVEVTVFSGRVAEIAITEHRTGQGQLAEAIVNSVIAQQSLDVEVVSGATWSSRTLLKAIEDALQPGGGIDD